MNKIEKTIYDLVKKNPKIKNSLRNIYQTAFDILPRKKEYFLNPIKYKENYFFGFHDLTPFSKDEKRILANHTLLSFKMPENNDLLDVGYFNFDNGEFNDFVKIGESAAWNFHKGCRLQWLDERSVIFNTADNNKLVSKIIDVENGNSTQVDFPIDTVSPDGKFATSFSYERLESLMPGYGYKYPDNSCLDEKYPGNTGLFLVDLRRNTSEMLVSLHELAQNSIDCSESENSWHYVTHTEFSPDNRYISFLHRWVGKDVIKRWSRLVAYDLNEHKLIVFPVEEMVSHYVWNKSNQIIAYCRVGGADCHALFNVSDVNNYRKVGERVLNSDGHQSFITDHSFITDTYPNKFRMANLFFVDITADRIERIASVYSPKKFQTKTFLNHIACDLHPRVSQTGNYVCFDAARTGKRSLCVMSIKM